MLLKEQYSFMKAITHNDEYTVYIHGNYIVKCVSFTDSISKAIKVYLSSMLLTHIKLLTHTNSCLLARLLLHYLLLLVFFLYCSNHITYSEEMFQVWDSAPSLEAIVWWTSPLITYWTYRRSLQDYIITVVFSFYYLAYACIDIPKLCYLVVSTNSALSTPSILIFLFDNIKSHQTSEELISTDKFTTWSVGSI